MRNKKEISLLLLAVAVVAGLFLAMPSSGADTPSAEAPAPMTETVAETGIIEFTRQPTDATVYAGASPGGYLFEVGYKYADGVGSIGLTDADYQMSRDGGVTWEPSNAPGGYGGPGMAGLWIGTVPSSYDGYMYRFYVSTAYEKAYSDSATLTVLSTHDHDPYDVVTFPSTCTDTGLKDIYCECGKLLESDVVIPALGHDWTLVYADNCGKVYKCERCEETYTINLDRVVASAVITDQNELVITIVERFADGTSATTSYSIMFDNNVAGTYKVGGYRVYVDAKDNDQIRACYILGG